MLKRRLLLSFLSFIFMSSSVFAYTGDNAFTGLYLAADIGAVQFLAKNKQTVTLTSTNVNVSNSDNHPTTAKTGFTGGGAIGFSYLSDNCFYIALEGRGDYQSPTIKSTRNTTTTVTNGGTTSTITTDSTRQVKIKDTYSVLLKPGFAVGQDREMIVYGIVGATSGKVSAKSSADITVSGAQNNTLSFSSSQKSSRTTGVSGGIGVEKAFFTSNATVGAEYVYTSYGSVKFNNGSGNTVGPNAAVLTVNNKVNVSTNTVMVKVAYRFPV